MKIKISTLPLMYLFSVILTVSIVIGCGKETTKTPEVKEKGDKPVTENKTSSSGSTGNSGKELFYLKSTENNIACADCHSDGTNTSNPMTKYFSNIQGADKRTSTYHGLFTGEEVIKNAAGATLCWQNYEKMKTPLTEVQIKSLNEFYRSVAGADTLSEIKYETIAIPTKDKSKLKEAQKVVADLTGDASKGNQTFNNACGSCHGETAFVKKVPSILEEFEGNEKSIIYNVRLGDGSMPFFSNTLSNQDLADISAYILQKSVK